MGEDGAELVVDDAEVRALAVLQLALGVGAALFWVAVVGLSQLPAPADQAPAPEQLGFIRLLSGVHALAALTSWTAGVFLYQSTLARGANLGTLRTATILRLALFEGPALFGATICLLAVQTRVAPELPLVWLNAASTFVLLGLVITTFPTRERVERVLRGRGQTPNSAMR